MPADGIHLRPLTDGDVAAIHGWPPYPPELARLDYALRPHGWLATFPASTRHVRLAIVDGDRLAGFSLLVDIEAGAAEFYIALHPDWLHRGLGRRATELTLAHGFDRLGLTRIHLKVRSWYTRAQTLYASLGFRPIGECVACVQGEPTQFIKMEKRKNASAPAEPSNHPR